MRLLSVLAAVVLALIIVAQPSATAHATYGSSYGHGNVHCLRYGETLYGVAYRYGTTAHAIAAANGIYNPNYVRAGQCLRIPAGYGHGYAKKAPQHYGKPVVKHAPRHAPVQHAKKGYHYGKMQGNRYCVRYGDTLSRIAYRHGTTAYAIAHANGLYNANHIYAGQCLTIPGYGY